MTTTPNTTNPQPPLPQRIKQKFVDHKDDLKLAGLAGLALTSTYLLGKTRGDQTIKVDLFRVIPQGEGNQPKVEHEQRFPDIPVQD